MSGTTFGSWQVARPPVPQPAGFAAGCAPFRVEISLKRPPARAKTSPFPLPTQPPPSPGISLLSRRPKARVATCSGFTMQVAQLSSPVPQPARLCGLAVLCCPTHPPRPPAPSESVSNEWRRESRGSFPSPFSISGTLRMFMRAGDAFCEPGGGVSSRRGCRSEWW